MGPRQVRVEVDHLGLDPEAELHAEPADRVDERVQAVRPHVFVDVPVAEPGGVVAAVPEPAVVEHVALDADLRREPGQLCEPAEVVVEVDGLPGVEHDRAGPARVVRAGAQVGVEAGGDGVEPHAVRPVHPRPGVGLPLRQHDLSGEKQLTAAEHGEPVGEALGVRHVVAAPRHVHRPDLALAGVEAARARGEDQRGVRAGTAAAVLPRVHADDEGQALRRPLAAPPAGEVEQLGRDGRHRQRERQAVDLVGALGGRGDRRALPCQTGRQELELDHEGEAGDLVHTGGDDPAAARRVGGGLEPGQGELRRPSSPRPGAAQAGPPVPPGGVLGKQGAERGGLVEVVRHRARHADGRERRQVVRAEVAEVVSPVHDGGQATADLEDQAHPGRPQVN